MIYDLPTDGAPIDQGDIIDGCPVLHVASFNVDDFETESESLEIEGSFCRVVVLSQTCDLANHKITMATVALIGLPEPYETE